MDHVCLHLHSPVETWNELNLLTATFKLLEHLNPPDFLGSL